MIVNLSYAAKTRLLRHYAAVQGYTVNKKRGQDWWRVVSVRRRRWGSCECGLDRALAWVLSETVNPEMTVH